MHAHTPRLGVLVTRGQAERATRTGGRPDTFEVPFRDPEPRAVRRGASGDGNCGRKTTTTTTTQRKFTALTV